MIAVITGVCGQDGSYLAEYLLEKNYTVIGISRQKSVEPGFQNIKSLFQNSNFIYLEGDLIDSTFISRILHEYKPHEFYNLAAQSNVGQSFKDPVYTFKVNAEAVITQLELIRQITPYTRYYQASTSEMFGGINCPETGYTEDSPFHPRSPYAVAKVAAYWATVNYREAYNIFACNGILFNHSSPRRSENFATRKITKGMARARYGLQSTIKMGNLSSFRDEGHSEDYIKAMYLMLQQREPDDFVIATGMGATIREMFEYVANLAGYTLDEVYEQDEKFMRPSDVPFLLGNSAKARDKLGWKPQYTWKELLKEMYNYDIELCKKELNLL